MKYLKAPLLPKALCASVSVLCATNLVTQVPSVTVESITGEQILATDTRSDVLIVPDIDQFDQLSEEQLKEFNDRAIEQGGVNVFAGVNQAQENANVQFFQARLIRVEPRSLNNPFDIEDPVNNAFPIDPPPVDPPPVMVPPPPIVGGQFFDIALLGTGGALGFDLQGGQFVEVLGLVSQATFAIQRDSSEISGTVSGVGLLPTAEAVFFNPAFEVSNVFNEGTVDLNQAVSSIQGDAYVLGQAQSFGFRQDGLEQRCSWVSMMMALLTYRHSLRTLPGIFI